MKKIVYLFLVLGIMSLACNSSELFQQPTTPTTQAKVLSVWQTDSQTEMVLKVTAAKALNLRDIPDATGPHNSSVILRMPGGSEVIWLNKCQGFWANVRYDGRVGWASSYLLDPKVCE